MHRGIFAAIWAASIFSAIGGQLQQVGAAWLMTSLDPSADMVALVTAVSTLPILLLSLAAGAMADVIDRRLVLLGAQLLMFAASATLAAMAFLDLVTPYLLLLLTFLVGVGAAVMAPAWQSIDGELVPRPEVPAAVGLNIMAFNIARTVGPAAGGVIVALAGSQLNFTLNAVSYLALIAVLFAWRPARKTSTIPAEAVLPAMRDGILYAFHASQVRHVLFRAMGFGFCGARWRRSCSTTRCCAVTRLAIRPVIATISSGACGSMAKGWWPTFPSADGDRASRAAFAARQTGHFLSGWVHPSPVPCPVSTCSAQLIWLSSMKKRSISVEGIGQDR